MKRVPPMARLRVFLRSLAIQASWNQKGMQNLGFAWALWPAIASLYDEQEEQKEALLRHLGFFNCHPYLAAAILGGTIFHEERIASGASQEESGERFKRALMFPLAAVGDGFFWLALRPFAGVVAVLSSPWSGLWAPLVFLCLYSLPHFGLRYFFFLKGCAKGDGVVAEISRLDLPAWTEGLGWAVAFLGGGAVAASAGMAASVLGGGMSAILFGWVGAACAASTGFLLSGRAGPAAAGAAAIGIGALLSVLKGFV